MVTEPGQTEALNDGSSHRVDTARGSGQRAEERREVEEKSS